MPIGSIGWVQALCIPASQSTPETRAAQVKVGRKIQDSIITMEDQGCGVPRKGKKEGRACGHAMEPLRSVSPAAPNLTYAMFYNFLTDPPSHIDISGRRWLGPGQTNVALFNFLSFFPFFSFLFLLFFFPLPARYPEMFG